MLLWCTVSCFCLGLPSFSFLGGLGSLGILHTGQCLNDRAYNVIISFLIWRHIQLLILCEDKFVLLAGPFFFHYKEGLLQQVYNSPLPTITKGLLDFLMTSTACLIRSVDGQGCGGGGQRGPAAKLPLSARAVSRFAGKSK